MVNGTTKSKIMKKKLIKKEGNAVVHTIYIKTIYYGEIIKN